MIFTKQVPESKKQLNRQFCARAAKLPRQLNKRCVQVLSIALFVMLVITVSAGCNAPAKITNVLAQDPADNSSVPQDTETEEDTFYDGIFVDNLALGGLSMDQARSKVEEQHKALSDAISLALTHAKGNLVITNSDVAYSFDTDAILKKAFEQGRTGDKKENQAFIEQLPANPVKLTTTLTVDPSPAEQKVRDYAASLKTPGVDAAYKDFDPTQPEGQQLKFTLDVPGTQVDPDKLWEQVKAAFVSGNFSTLAVQDDPLPALTVAELQSSLQLIGTFTTTIKNHSAPRLVNIDLVNKCISGMILQPGDTLSVNKLTGERTSAKGYKKAPVDANGIEDVGLGGGACQVSGSLYNAAISAGPNRIKIVEREHHSLPSAYMKKGTDATVDYPNKDLQLMNISDKPMLVIMYFMQDTDGKYYEHANIYGTPDPEGATYQLEGVVVHTILGDPNAPPRIVPNNALAPGETKLIPAHNGSVVDVYLVKTTKDGIVSKIKLYTDRYPASGPVQAYYAKDPQPSPTPSDTPVITDGSIPIPSDTPVVTDGSIPIPSNTPVATPAVPAPTA